MRLCHFWLISTVFAVSITASLAFGGEPAPTDANVQTFSVSETYNNSPFDYQMKLLAQRDGFRVYRVTYPSPVVTPDKRNNTIHANLYLPDNIAPGSSKRPGVITLHILNGFMLPTDLACSLLAMRGIPAIMPTLPYYNERAKAEGWEAMLRDPKLFLAMLLQSTEDIRRTADLLASRSEVDPQRIGISGASLGSIVAATAACKEPRFYRTALFLSGGDLMKILPYASYTRGLSERFRQLPSEERVDIEARVNAIDPVQLAPALRERAQQGRVLMVNVTEDEIIPRASTERLATALGIADRVVWLQGHTHDTFISAIPQSLRLVTEFFAQDLPADAPPSRPPVYDGSTPSRLAAALIHQMLAMFETVPNAGCCNRMEMDVTAGPKGQKPFESPIRLVRGTADKFVLKCRLPVIGEVTIGQREYPWMITTGKSVLMGVKNPSENHDPLSLVDPKHLARLRVVGGVIGSLDLVPDMLDQWGVVATDGQPTDGNRAIRLTAKAWLPGTVLASFQKDNQTPTELAFDISGITGKAVVRDWQVNAVAEDTMFNPPSDLPVVEVEQADLYRMFATIFGLTMSGTN